MVRKRLFDPADRLSLNGPMPLTVSQQSALKSHVEFMMIGGSSIMAIADVLPAPAVAPNRSVVAAVIGNAMEWYDFAVYGFFASTIGKLFFPASEPSLSVIAALAVFAVGFLMRPIGGVAFGYIGDRYSRTFSLFLSIGAWRSARWRWACCQPHRKRRE